MGMRRLAGWLVIFFAAGCGDCFGLDFSECEEDGDCGRDQYCSQHFLGSTCEDYLQRGQSCGFGRCLAGLICHHGYEPARCEPPGKAGSVCSRSDDCADMLRCNSGFTPSRCEPPGPEGSVCGDSWNCEEDLGCNRPDPERPGTCIELGSLLEGAPCNFFEACEEGLGCVEKRCIAPGGEGDRCIGYELGDFSDCEGELYCFEERCTPFGRQGERCGKCVEDLVCHRAFDPPRCELPSTEGMPCHVREDCASGLICAADATCIVPGDVGDPCYSSIECDGPFVCVLGACAERYQEAGERCVLDQDCALGVRCLGGVCGGT